MSPILDFLFVVYFFKAGSNKLDPLDFPIVKTFFFFFATDDALILSD